MFKIAWILGVCCMLAGGSSALAQAAACGSRAALIEALKSKYREDRQFLGLVGTTGTGMMEVFVSKEGTWTMLVTMATGQTCIMAAGHSFEAMPKSAAGTGI